MSCGPVGACRGMSYTCTSPQSWKFGCRWRILGAGLDREPDTAFPAVGDAAAEQRDVADTAARKNARDDSATGPHDIGTVGGVFVCFKSTLYLLTA
ncbi:hypothetical protein MTO96_041479 [Rhipicephalus appendiculatus]